MKNGDYILIVAPIDYPGKKYRARYAYEHQVVWWQQTNTLVPYGYMIHHINENKHDNSFTNLELISRKTHASIHAKALASPIALICDYCKEPFTRARRNVLHKKSKGQTRFYCCRSHQVIDQQKRLKNIPS